MSPKHQQVTHDIRPFRSALGDKEKFLGMRLPTSITPNVLTIRGGTVVRANSVLFGLILVVVFPNLLLGYLATKGGNLVYNPMSSNVF